ncbi:MAG: hypothetical protein LPJ87_09460 [Zoogloeaceae bacterium]|nr:hypothetical protein [Zoogloeaceae bacterium]
MRRETAYKLAGRNHEHPSPGAGLVKERELRFAQSPAGQVARARSALEVLKGVSVSDGATPHALCVRYSILDYSLELLEDALRDAGYHLDNGLYAKLVRAIVYFCEETQRHNLLSPERLIKKSNEVYIKVYDQHPHGDHDDTPVELREYK